MKATPKALILAHKVKAILEQAKQLMSPIDFDPKKSEMTFRIGMSDYAEYALLPKLLPLFDKQAPHAKLKIVHLNSLDKREPFHQFNIHLGIGVIFEKISEVLETETLFTDTSVCVADAKHPLMQKKITLKQYLNAKHLVIIFPEEPYRGCVDTTLDRLGYKRNYVVAVPHMLPALFSLSHTPYIVTTTRIIANSIAKSLKLSIQLPPFESHVVEVKQAWLKQYNNDPAHTWLRSIVKQAAQMII